jgi:hypothetical protein
MSVATDLAKLFAAGGGLASAFAIFLHFRRRPEETAMKALAIEFMMALLTASFVAGVLAMFLR